MTLNMKGSGTSKHRHLLQMITSGNVSTKQSEIADLLNNKSMNMRDEKKRKYEGYLGHSNTKSMYLPGSLHDITSGREAYLVAKGPEKVVKNLAEQRRPSTDFVLAEFQPSDLEVVESRENSAKSSKRHRIAVSYSKPEPPDPDRPEIQTPGPNQYDVKNGTIEQHIKKMPKFTLKGREPLRSPDEVERIAKNRVDSPSPQSYNPYEKLKSKKFVYSMPKTKRDAIDKWLLEIPAPNKYSPDKGYHVAGTVVMKRPLLQEEAERKKEREKSPGPGQYYKMEKKLDSGFFRFGKDERFGYVQSAENPEVSPLKYDPKISMVKENIPRVKIGKANRFDKETLSDAPGVGKYQVKLSGLTHVSVKFGTQRRFMRQLVTVGVAH